MENHCNKLSSDVFYAVGLQTQGRQAWEAGKSENSRCLSKLNPSSFRPTQSPLYPSYAWPSFPHCKILDPIFIRLPSAWSERFTHSLVSWTKWSGCKKNYNPQILTSVLSVVREGSSDYKQCFERFFCLIGKFYVFKRKKSSLLLKRKKSSSLRKEEAFFESIGKVWSAVGNPVASDEMSRPLWCACGLRLAHTTLSWGNSAVTVQFWAFRGNRRAREPAWPRIISHGQPLCIARQELSQLSGLPCQSSLTVFKS